MNNAEYADYQEAEAQGAYPLHGTIVQVYWEIEYIGGRKADAASLQDALRAISKTCGIDNEHLTVIEIERGLVEVYASRFKWLGVIATIMELQAECDI